MLFGLVIGDSNILPQKGATSEPLGRALEISWAWRGCGPEFHAPLGEEPTAVVQESQKVRQISDVWFRV